MHIDHPPPLNLLAKRFDHQRSVVFSIFMLFVCFGCEDEPQDSTPPPMMDAMVFGEGGEEGGEEGGGEGGDNNTQTNLKTYLSYTRLVSELGSSTRGDLVIFDTDDQEEIWLNEGISGDEMDCVTRGCQLHPDLTWVGWLNRDMGIDTLWVAPINQDTRTVQIDEKRELASQIIRFKFTQNNIVYTEIKDATAFNGTAVKVEPIDGSTPPVEVALVNADGGFSVTLADELLIIIKTTLSNMNISFLNISNEQIFDLFTFGEESGTGSEFSASISPVRFAPDNTYLVAITSNEFMWRAHTLEATDVIVEPVSHDLFPVRNVEEACTGNYPYTQVLNEPIFSKDSEYFYLLFGGDCTQREIPTANRQDYEIYRFARDLTQAPKNITNIPRINHWSNHDIRSFAISPDESQIAFVSTRPNKNGTYSIWLMNIEEESDTPSFDCSRSAGQSDPLGTTRCEYIFFDSDAQVEYRSVTFHSIGDF